jgi:GDP-D-mannose dehydratase
MSDIAGYEITVKINPAFVRANDVRRLVGIGTKLMRRIGTVPSIPMEETLRWMFLAPRPSNSLS